MSDTTMDDLLHRLQELEAEIARLETHAAAAPNDSGASQAAGPGEPDRTASRRDLIRAGGAVAPR